MILIVLIMKINFTKYLENEDRTPPAPAAIAGAMRTLAFLRTSTASGMQGMFEPTLRNKIIFIVILCNCGISINRKQNNLKNTMHITFNYYTTT